MKKVLVSMSLAVLASTLAFAQLGPKPQLASGGRDISFALPFAKVQILEVSDFRLTYPKDGFGHEFTSVKDASGNVTYARYVWLYFTAKLKNPTGKRILLKNFVGQASLRFLSPNGGKDIVEIDVNGNPVARKLYNDLVLGSYRVANGQVFEISSAEDKMEFVINLGALSNGSADKLNLETRDKLTKIFNIFANSRNRGEYELHLTGRAIPGILGDNGAWVFGESIDYVWVFDMKEGSGISFGVKATEAK